MSDEKRRLPDGTEVRIVGPDFNGSYDLSGEFGRVVQTVHVGGLPTHELRTTYEPGKPGYQVDTGDTIVNVPDDSVEIVIPTREALLSALIG